MNSIEKRINNLEGALGSAEYMICHQDIETGKYRLIGKGIEDTALYALDYLEALARSQGKDLITVSYVKKEAIDE